MELLFAGSVLTLPLTFLHPLLLFLPLCASSWLFLAACRHLQNSMHDPLTGLSNLRKLDQLRRHYRKIPAITVVYIDLNDLKQINDSLGHETGNAKLVEVALVLNQLCRKKEIAYRIGGDEFLLISESADASQMLGRIALAQEYLRRTGISFGIATGTGSELDSLIHAADQNMYAMKSAE